MNKLMEKSLKTYDEILEELHTLLYENEIDLRIDAYRRIRDILLNSQIISDKDFINLFKNNEKNI